MRQIDYNNSAFTMRLEYPPNWDVDNLTGVTVQVANLDGEELLAAAATTLLTAATISAAASVGDSTITVGGVEMVPSPGDRLRIAASNDGPAEEVEVQSFNSSTSVATLRRELRYAHTSGAALKGLFCTYDLDTSTVATWTASLQLVFTWTPGGSDDIPIKERGEVAKFSYSFPDFARRFEIRFPREWKISEYRIQELLVEAVKGFELTLSSRDFHIHRMVNQELVHEAILTKARLLVVLPLGDSWTTEREVAQEEYDRNIEILTNQPVWQDENQDGVKDDIEVDDYSGFLGLERGS